MTNVEKLTNLIEAQADVKARDFDAAGFLAAAEACTSEERRAIAKKYREEYEGRSSRQMTAKYKAEDAEKAGDDAEADAQWDIYEEMQAESKRRDSICKLAMGLK